MSPSSEIFLIEMRDGGRPISLFLQVWEDASGETSILWSRDTSHALRFATKRLADQHIQDELDHDAVAVPVDPAEILPFRADRDCGCTSGFVCRHNMACPRMTTRRHQATEE